jgi:hypothetical protein
MNFKGYEATQGLETVATEYLLKVGQLAACSAICLS